MAWLVTWTCEHCCGMGGDSHLFKKKSNAKKFARELEDGTNDIEIERVEAKKYTPNMSYEDK